jgi:hypothetical protein
LTKPWLAGKENFIMPFKMARTPKKVASSWFKSVVIGMP